MGNIKNTGDEKVYTWKQVQALAHIASINARTQEGRRSMGQAGILAGQLAAFLRLGSSHDQANIDLLDKQIREVNKAFGRIESILTVMTNKELAMPYQTTKDLQAVIDGDVWGERHRALMDSEPPANS